MIVLDTNVVSELMRPAPSPAVVAWVRSHDQARLSTTAITLAEVRHGIERLPAGRRRDALRAAADEVFSTFTEHVLPFDAAAATAYAGIVGARERAGRPVDGFDAQIAAICRTHDATLATRDSGGFSGTGVDVVDPWHVPT